MSGGPLLDLLPELILNRGEVERIGQYPAGSSTTTDIWEGTYLGKVKVAIRTIRALKCDQKTLQARHSFRRNSTFGLISFQRFKREANIWADIQKSDRGRHILPFYGICFDDGPYP